MNRARLIARGEDTAVAALARLLPRRMMRDKRHFTVWERRGYHVTPVHFYEPIPDTQEVSKTADRISTLPGLDLREEEQLAFLTDLVRWRDEYEALDRLKEPGRFALRNNYFGPVDAEVYWCMIRLHRPRRIFEIGAGHSTLLAAEATRANERDGAPACEVVAFEPFPSDTLRHGFTGLTRLEQVRLQDVPLETFDVLHENDILFVDSSHVVATGSDVCVEVLEILPRLRPGVLIHFHDVFLPREYPHWALFAQRVFWTEQYLLQAFLAFNREFTVRWAAAFMEFRHPDRLAAAFASYERGVTQPGSLWIVRSP